MALKRFREEYDDIEDTVAVHEQKKSKISTTYSFTFEVDSLDNNHFPYLPSLIPKEIWVAHIIPYLDNDDKTKLRATCRGFFMLVTPYWKFTLYGPFMDDFIEFKDLNPNWPTFPLVFNMGIKSSIGLWMTAELKTRFADFDYNTFRKIDTVKDIGITTVELKLDDNNINLLPTSLTSLYLSEKKNLVDLSRVSFPKNLVDLTLWWLPHLTRVNFSSLQCLQSLRIEACELLYDIMPSSLPSTLVSMTVNDVPSLMNLNCFPPYLKTLNLIRCKNIVSNDLKGLPSTLTHLDISVCTQIYDEDLPQLPPNLITMQAASIQALGSEFIKKLPQTLQALDIAGCDGIDDTALVYLPKSLSLIDLSECNDITGLGLRILPQVKCLRLSECRQLGDEDLHSLPNSITHLQIEGCDLLTKEVLNYLPTSLIHLRVEGSGITPEDVYENFSRFPALEWFAETPTLESYIIA